MLTGLAWEIICRVGSGNTSPFAKFYWRVLCSSSKQLSIDVYYSYGCCGIAGLVAISGSCINSLRIMAGIMRPRAIVVRNVCIGSAYAWRCSCTSVSACNVTENWLGSWWALLCVLLVAEVLAGNFCTSWLSLTLKPFTSHPANKAWSTSVVYPGSPSALDQGLVWRNALFIWCHRYQLSSVWCFRLQFWVIVQNLCDVVIGLAWGASFGFYKGL